MVTRSLALVCSLVALVGVPSAANAITYSGLNSAQALVVAGQGEDLPDQTSPDWAPGSANLTVLPAWPDSSLFGPLTVTVSASATLASDLGTYSGVQNNFNLFFTNNSSTAYNYTLTAKLSGDFASTSFGSPFGFTIADGDYLAVFAEGDLAPTFIGQLLGGQTMQLWGNTHFVQGGESAQLDMGLALNLTPVPESETWAMMLAGLGVLGFVARRRG